MKVLFALTAAALLAGCATTENQQLAQAECKVHPITTRSYTDVRKPATSGIDQADAQATLANSDYRMRQLQTRGLAMNNVEDALRDCSMAR
jgi:uncharacterized lipoprotein YajG